METSVLRRRAYRLILLLGLVSLFGDITYEGVRGITGPYLALLGASATAVGIVAGLGEFLGYAFRTVAGYIADRFRSYWLLTVVGYALVGALPLLALTQRWELAALLIVLERLGKALRTPSRDAILSHAASQV
ncbi:MAG: MFS transporter, partial [Thermomicrobium sp.]